MNQISYQNATSLHDYILEISGGMSGIRDSGQLESTLIFVDDNEYYRSFEEKLCYLIYSIATGHAFVDGNKRTSIALGGLLMFLNGYGDLVPYYFTFMEGLVLSLVERKIKREKFIEIIKFYISKGFLSEEHLLFMLEQREKSVKQ